MQSFLYKEVSHHHLHLADTERQSEEEEDILVIKRKGFRCALIRDCWHGELQVGLTRRPVSFMIYQVCRELSGKGSKLEARTKVQETVSY